PPAPYRAWASPSGRWTPPPQPPPSPRPRIRTTRPVPAAAPPPTPSSPDLWAGSHAREGSHDQRQAPTGVGHHARECPDPRRKRGAGIHRAGTAVSAGRGRVRGHAGGDRVPGGGRCGVVGAAVVVAGPPRPGDAHRPAARPGRRRTAAHPAGPVRV